MPCRLNYKYAIPFAVLTFLLCRAPNSRADSITECTINKFCYCVNFDLKNSIDNHVAQIRELISHEKRNGKAIGYMSIPLSTGEGSYFAVNARVASEVKKRVEARFGVTAAWLLNPALQEIALPKNATGADYMLMWTRVLEGDDGQGNDFDFVYFVGPSDFARHFSLNNRADMKKLGAYYDTLSKIDPSLKNVDKNAFRNYYALRASVAFSNGSHDEWNIVRAINEKRRHADRKGGVLKQLGLFFDGRAMPPGMFDSPIASGYAQDCKSNQ